MWVVLRHSDGTASVYGHINRSLVEVGKKVKAGDEIAEVGNRGQSTGPHLHLEVWEQDGTKTNPLPWLLARGINVDRPGGGRGRGRGLTSPVGLRATASAAARRRSASAAPCRCCRSRS